MEWIWGLFTGAPGDMSRVGVWGLAVMLAGAILVIFAGGLARRFAGDGKAQNMKLVLKLAGLALVMVGALGAMKVIG